MRAAVAGVVLALAALTSGPAYAEETITAGPLPNTFGTPEVTIDQGETVTFRNSDPTGAPHDVTATGRDGDDKPLFASATITNGRSAPVAGVEFLTTGDYPFVCSVHPSMMGTLHVTAEGTPKPRTPENPAPSPADTTPPEATVKILDSRVAAVLDHRGLRVRLATNEPARFRLAAMAGKTKVAAGEVTTKGRRTTKLALTKKGRALLKKGGPIKLKLSARVNDAADNRSSATAARTLR